MRGHRQTPPKYEPELTSFTAGDFAGATVYRQNGRFYYHCQQCNVHGGGIERFSRFMQSLYAHEKKCTP